MRAASIAVLPPPTMPTTRPSDGARPFSTRSISVTASMILPPSMAGMSRWFATWAPIPRNTASNDARGFLGQHVVHARVANDRHAHRLDARDFLVEPLARQAVRGNPVVHHAARLGVRIADLDVVSEPPQVVRARQARRAGADDEHPLAGGRTGGDRPPLLVGEIAEKPVERMDRDGRIEELPVAGAFAGVIARAAVRAGQRVLLHVPSARRPRSRPPAPGRAMPGCSPRPDRRGCRAEDDRRRGGAAIDARRRLCRSSPCKPASDPSERDSQFLRGLGAYRKALARMTSRLGRRTAA